MSKIHTNALHRNLRIIIFSWVIKSLLLIKGKKHWGHINFTTFNDLRKGNSSYCSDDGKDGCSVVGSSSHSLPISSSSTGASSARSASTARAVASSEPSSRRDLKWELFFNFSIAKVSTFKTLRENYLNSMSYIS